MTMRFKAAHSLNPAYCVNTGYVGVTPHLMSTTDIIAIGVGIVARNHVRQDRTGGDRERGREEEPRSKLG